MTYPDRSEMQLQRYLCSFSSPAMGTHFATSHPVLPFETPALPLKLLAGERKGKNTFYI